MILRRCKSAHMAYYQRILRNTQFRSDLFPFFFIVSIAFSIDSIIKYGEFFAAEHPFTRLMPTGKQFRGIFGY